MSIKGGIGCGLGSVGKTRTFGMALVLCEADDDDPIAAHIARGPSE